MKRFALRRAGALRRGTERMRVAQARSWFYVTRLTSRSHLTSSLTPIGVQERSQVPPQPRHRPNRSAECAGGRRERRRCRQKRVLTQSIRKDRFIDRFPTRANQEREADGRRQQADHLHQPFVDFRPGDTFERPHRYQRKEPARQIITGLYPNNLLRRQGDVPVSVTKSRIELAISFGFSTIA